MTASAYFLWCALWSLIDSSAKGQYATEVLAYHLHENQYQWRWSTFSTLLSGKYCLCSPSFIGSICVDELITHITITTVELHHLAPNCAHLEFIKIEEFFHMELNFSFYVRWHFFRLQLNSYQEQCKKHYRLSMRNFNI